MAKTRIYSWNVNGLRAIAKKGFLEWVQKTQPDYLAIQETKAEPSQLSEELLKLDGYHVDFNAATIRKGYSGVATYSQEVPAKVIAGFNDTRFDADGRVLTSEFKKFVLFNIYFPNGGRGPEWVRYKLDFYKRFLELIKHYQDQGRSVVAVGDTNTAYSEIDLARSKENVKNSGFLPEERHGLGEFFAAGLIDTYRLLHPDQIQYSYWDQKSGARQRNVGWRIDGCYISSELKDRLVAAEIHDAVMGSDHCPISITLDL